MIDCLTRDPLVALGRGPDGGREGYLERSQLESKRLYDCIAFPFGTSFANEASERHGGEGAMRSENDPNRSVNLAGYPRPARLGLSHLALIVTILACVVIANW
jgi:hypothetical protein